MERLSSGDADIACLEDDGEESNNEQNANTHPQMIKIAWYIHQYRKNERVGVDALLK